MESCARVIRCSPSTPRGSSARSSRPRLVPPGEVRPAPCGGAPAERPRALEALPQVFLPLLPRLGDGPRDGGPLRAPSPRPRHLRLVRTSLRGPGLRRGLRGLRGRSCGRDFRERACSGSLPLRRMGRESRRVAFSFLWTSPPGRAARRPPRPPQSHRLGRPGLRPDSSRAWPPGGRLGVLAPPGSSWAPAAAESPSLREQLPGPSFGSPQVLDLQKEKS